MSDADILGDAQAQVEDVVHRDELVAAVTKVRGAGFKMPTKPATLNVPFLQQLYSENGWGDFSHERKVECLVALVDGWRMKTAPASTETLTRGEKFLRGLAGRFS